jgi:hypothetical protein
VPLPWLVFRKIGVWDQARERKHQRLGSSKPAGRIYSINDREEGVWMHSGDRCAVAFVAGRGTSEAGGWRLEARERRGGSSDAVT